VPTFAKTELFIGSKEMKWYNRGGFEIQAKKLIA